MNGLIYVFHGVFWSAFLARAVRKRREAMPTSSVSAEALPLGARVFLSARIVFVLHGIGFGFLYAGIAEVVLGRYPVPEFFHLHWGVGALLILLAAATFASALYVFDSWRLLAKIDEGHKLCTRGPYSYLRHPIYLACHLLAIGTFLWMPTVTVGMGTTLMLIAGDLRARAEEKVLRRSFGEEYRRYEASVKRYVPGVY